CVHTHACRKNRACAFLAGFRVVCCLFYRFPVRNALRASQAVLITDVMVNQGRCQPCEQFPQHGSFSVVRGAIDLQPVPTSNAGWWRIFIIANSAVTAILFDNCVSRGVHFTFLKRAAITTNFAMRCNVNRHFVIPKGLGLMPTINGLS
ncbi:hypothetical protein, partial [Klebsiella variicola]|uniref:hypothetical protein n=1 Tax=Klebsiella variicola TaxID=244366 RepID=UPI001C47B63C